MSELAKYNPLKSISIPDADEILIQKELLF
jgi:hypothetical protein